MADDIDVNIGAQVAAALAGISEVGQSIQALAAPVRALQAVFVEAGAALSAAFAANRIADFIGTMEELGVQTQRTATLLGISASSVSAIDIGAKAAGGSLEGLTLSMERLGLQLARADAGSQQAKAALQALGISAQQFIGLPTEAKLALLADKFSVLKDGTEKDAIAMALLGRAGAQMIPIFNQGSAAFAEFGEIAKRAGSEATSDFLARTGQLHMQTIELDKSFQGVAITMTGIFGSALAGMQKVMIDVVQSFNNAVREGGVLRSLLEDLAAAARVFATAIAVSVASVQILWEITNTAIRAMADAFMGLGRIIKDAFTFNWSDMKAAWDDLQAALTARAAKSVGDIATTWKNLSKELSTIWRGNADEHVKIEQDKLARLNIVNRDAVAAQMKAIEEEIKLVQEGLKQKTLLFDAEAKLGQVTQNQKFTALQQYTEQAYQQELALLEKERALGGMTLAQQQDVLNKIKQLKATHATQMLQLDLQSIQAQMAMWKQYTDTLASSFNSGLRGILTGTMTWTQALKNILLELSLKTIELLVTKPVAEFLAGQLAMLTAAQTGAAAQAAAQVAGTATTLPARAGKFISDITSDAAAVFAGIFANLAPLLGPAAAGPAGVGQATVLAQLAAVPKFDVGAWSVPRTGLAMVHQDELIAPAGAPAEAARSAFAGGGQGGAGTIIIQALDGASVHRVVKQHADLFNRVLSGRRSISPSTA